MPKKKEESSSQKASAQKIEAAKERLIEEFSKMDKLEALGFLSSHERSAFIDPLFFKNPHQEVCIAAIKRLKGTHHSYVALFLEHENIEVVAEALRMMS